MLNEKTSTEGKPNERVSIDRKDPVVRSTPLNEIDFDAAMTSKKDVVEKTKSKSSDSDPDTNSNKDVKDEETGASRDASSEDDDSQPKKSKGLEKKFKKLTSERTALKEANDALMARLEALESKVTGKTDEKSAKGKPEPDTDFKYDKPRPKLDDFETVSDHAEAVADWTYSRNKARDNHESAKEKQRSSSESLYSKFFEKGRELDKELGLEPGEFEATLKDEDFRPYVSVTVALAEMEGDTGNRIAYQIASDEKERDKFNKLSEIKQLTYIGKLEAKFDTAEVSSGGNNFSNKAPMSKAKPPAKPLKGSTGTVKFDTSRPISELAGIKFDSQADYKRLRNNKK